MSKTKIVLVACSVFLLLGLLVTTACAPKAEVVKKEIRIGGIYDLTGPTGPGGVPLHAGTSDYFKYVNEVKGGIKGAKVVLDWVDCKYELPRAQTAYMRMVDEGVVMVTCNLAPIVGGLRASFAKDRTPCQSSNPDWPAVYPPGWAYTDCITYPDHFGAVVDWLVKTRGKPALPKLGLLAWDAPFGRAIIPDGVPYAEGKGVKVVAIEFMPPAGPDVTTQLTRIRDAGANYVYMNVTELSLPIALKDADRMGLIGKITFAMCSKGDMRSVVKAVGKKAEGCLWPFEYALYHETDISGVKFIREYGTRYGRSEEFQSHFSYINGYVSGQVMEKVLELALEKVGLDKLDGAAVKEYGFERMKDFSPKGLSAPITYKGEDRRGPKKTRIFEVKNGELTVAADWFDIPRIMPTGYDPARPELFMPK